MALALALAAAALAEPKARDRGGTMRDDSGFINVGYPTFGQRPRTPEERGMRIIMSIAAAAVLCAAVVAPVSAAPGDAYKARKAECKARAKTMDFGVHFIKKNRWVNDCIAGRHSA